VRRIYQRQESQRVLIFTWRIKTMKKDGAVATPYTTVHFLLAIYTEYTLC
jgi:hypothetical protein